MTKIKLSGDFTEGDLRRFANLLRRIEEKNPERFYLMFIEVKDLKLEEGKKLILDIFPKKKKLKKEEIIKIHDILIKRFGGKYGIKKDKDNQLTFISDFCLNILDQAENICFHRPFVDGNIRTSYVICKIAEGKKVSTILRKDGKLLKIFAGGNNVQK